MSFEYRLKLHFGWRRNNRPKRQFRTFSSSTPVQQPVPKVAEFVNSPIPHFEEIDNSRMKFYWKKLSFKFAQFEECLEGLNLTEENGKSLSSVLSSYTSSKDEHVLVFEKCKVRKITVTYLFKGDYPPLEIPSTPKFCPPTLQDEDTTMNNTITTEPRMLKDNKSICAFGSAIVTSFAMTLILTSVLVGNRMVKRERAKKSNTEKSQSRFSKRVKVEVQHLTYNEARGIRWPGNHTEGNSEIIDDQNEMSKIESDRKETKSEYNSQFPSKTIKGLFEENVEEMRSENEKLANNGLRYSIQDRESGSSTEFYPSSSPSSSPSSFSQSASSLPSSCGDTDREEEQALHPQEQLEEQQEPMPPARPDSEDSCDSEDLQRRWRALQRSPPQRQRLASPGDGLVLFEDEVLRLEIGLSPSSSAFASTRCSEPTPPPASPPPVFN